ncbi:hypothetical protein PV10_08707 [Exophiala mesophila]|uniref:Ca2+-modulated nonselective cation channel polycystin n=1 Tax=Exophiala mesophila TaxID=212818 RepID=A0A0D1ZQR1_EXOME|nr:uncharacterized protein PV10_08707 [Exophiala mesophila]KIV89103.1 hypothetical protein PV10_08707 [Exophiala mesophila]
MASTEGPQRHHDRHARRRPFAAWMRRLANLKTLHSDSNDSHDGARRSNLNMNIKSKRANIAKNNPYPLSSRPDAAHNHSAYSTPLSSVRSRQSSLSQSKHSVSISHDSHLHNKSRAPTLATTAETTHSDAAPSGAGTSQSAPRTEGGRDSTFSSPAPSVRSFATTLTTVQSIAPAQHNLHNPSTLSQPSPTPPAFQLQPATAVPAHLAPHSHPTTYHTATANNVLTDDASILTLASSSKRRRRNSVDTNASMKALAPASMFGGSRESLPLSVLSGTMMHSTSGADTASLRETSTSGAGAGGHSRPLNAERASLISASGIAAPALASERNSYIGSKYGGGDAASVRSGLLGGGGHGRTDSVSGSIGGTKDLRDRAGDGTLVNGPGMVTAPTSPLIDGPGSATAYTSALGDVSEALKDDDDGDDQQVMHDRPVLGR